MYGYQGKRGRSNLYILPSQEVAQGVCPTCISHVQLAYYIAGVGVIFNAEANTQRFYTGHDNDIKRSPSRHILHC